MPRQVYFFLIILSCLTFSLNAQSVLRGSVKDIDNGQALIGATIKIHGIDLGTNTDSLGQFRFENILPGRYQVHISYLGYQQLTINEVLLSSAKERVLYIELSEAATSLTSVIVKGRRGNTTSPNLFQITQEETVRFPATFFDPARLATSYPGINSVNDQANHLIIRGQSPIGMKWRLEGMEIVNPNHTANAGTFSDRTTLAGGGINAFSAQMLEEAQFYVGNSPANMGNATAGIMNMQLRHGNNEQREHSIQAGFIGFDFSSEGPLKQGKSSYLLNYRYSFTGLLSDLGVPLGNEDIRFQDLSFKLHFPYENGSQLSVFGLWGKSSNYFQPPTDSLDWESEKDLYSYINFDSQLGALGFNWTHPQGDKGLWTFAGIFSSLETEREAQAIDISSREWDKLHQEKTVIKAAYQHKLLPFGNITLGIEALHLDQSSEVENPFVLEIAPKSENNDWILNPYMNWRYQIKKINIQLGLRTVFFPSWDENKIHLDERISLSYLLAKNNTIGFDYGQQTQHPSPFVNIQVARKSKQWSLFWSRFLKEDVKFSILVYHQQLSDFAGQGVYSEINQLEAYIPDNNQLTNGKTSGIEISLQHFANGNWWYILSASLFDARYQNEQDEWLKTRYASDYNTSATIGKEWSGTDREGQQRLLGINMAIHLNGGQRSIPILINESRQAQTTIFDYNKGFTQQLPDYLRVDFRLYFRKNRPQWNSILSLDIQNFSGQENVAYDYYDRFTKQVERRYQLPLIPIMSYQLNF